jgi:hypothetical protein
MLNHSTGHEGLQNYAIYRKAGGNKMCIFPSHFDTAVCVKYNPEKMTWVTNYFVQPHNKTWVCVWVGGGGGGENKHVHSVKLFTLIIITGSTDNKF